jgi:hypothetical protein
VPDSTESNGCLPSTTWAYKKVKITPPAEGQGSARRKADLLRRLAIRDARKPTTLVVTYRGGAECWVEVRARGRVYRRPGYTALSDLVLEIAGGIGGKSR